jgi:hypothetical protein
LHFVHSFSNLRSFEPQYVADAKEYVEEKAADEAARAKEVEEQAALPYKWTQTIGDLDITAEIPGNLKAKDLIVDIKKTKLVVGIKGQEPILSVSISCCIFGALPAPFKSVNFNLLIAFQPLRATSHTLFMLMSQHGLCPPPQVRKSRLKST